MKVLIIGGGGREHALAYKIARSPLVDAVLVAPGNAGTAVEPKTRNVAIPATDITRLVELARAERVDLTVVGPETPLVAGIVNRFDAAGLRCFGPRAAPAQLEGSKAFAKAFLVRHGIPTARYRELTSFDEARAYAATLQPPIVVKADGLAAGKGVVIAATHSEAEQALDAMLRRGTFGEAGGKVVIEEFLEGEEASFIALVDGERIVPLASSQDHKRRDDGDRGPNTGGMGAYSPAPVVTDAVHERIMGEIMLPTVRGLVADGLRYRGFLYAGLMISSDGKPKVIEFNCRLGDPEAQPLLFRLRTDLVETMLECFAGTLGDRPLEWDPRPAIGVVIASRGYPDSYEKGQVVTGLDTAPRDSKVFHAGTRRERDTVLTDGGRVFCAVALGDDIAAARAQAYAAARAVRFDGAFYRTDIAHRALSR